MANILAVYNNPFRFEVEGSFDLSAAAAVLSITAGLETLTCRGVGMTCVKGIAGTYAITLKNPGIQIVALLNANANIMSLTLGGALMARVISVSQASTGDITITVITAATGVGAVATDTTTAITVGFSVVLQTSRVERSI